MKNALILVALILFPLFVFSQGFNNNMQFQSQQRMMQQIASNVDARFYFS